MPSLILCNPSDRRKEFFMNSISVRTTLRRFLLLFAAFCCLLLLPSAAETRENKIASVTVDEGGLSLTVKAEFGSTYVSSDPQKMVYLFGLLTCDNESELSSLSPIAVVRIGASVTQTVSLENGQDDLLYARFLFAEKDGTAYRAVTNAAYVSDPEQRAVSTFDFPEKRSKKGLRIQMDSDAQLLGVSHTVINVPINRFFTENRSGQETVSFLHAGKTYYLKKNQVELLDHSVRNYTKAGINCILSVLLTAPEPEQDTALDCLYADGVSGDEASLFAVNTANRDALSYFEALMEFLAERYTRPDGEYGFAGSFIIGSTVNSNRIFNYMGEKNLSAYVSSYASLLRTAYTAAVSRYQHARIYVPIGNNFNQASADTSLRENPLLDYAGKAFLDALASEIRLTGDFSWRVAVNPYSSDPGSTDFRQDALAEDTIDTPYITMKNIEVLCRYLASDEIACRGSARSILVADFAVSGEYGTESEAMQAALFCYAYYKCCTLDQIDAMIWHIQSDHPDETGSFGIWASERTGNTLLPTAKKKLYQSFRYIDTVPFDDPSYRQTSIDFALPLLGVSAWDELFPGFDPEQASVKAICEQIPVSSQTPEKQYTARTLFDFSGDSLYSFYPSDYVNYIEQRDDPAKGQILYAQLFPANRTEYRGIADFGSIPFSLENAAYISVSLYADMPQTTSKVTVMLRFSGMNGNTETVFEGIAQTDANTWCVVYFPVEQYAELVKEAKDLRIWIKAQDEQTSDEACALAVSRITLYTKSGITGWKTLIIIAAVITGLITVGLVLLLFTARGKQRKQKRRREEKRHRMKHGTASVRYRYRSNRDASLPGNAPAQHPKKQGPASGKKSEENRNR